MKQILVFGAGKSATTLIDYLVKLVADRNWHVKVVDSNLALAQSKTHQSPYATALAIDVEQDTERSPLIAQADIVISLLPPSLHFLVAKDCVQHRKNLLTASYVDEKIAALSPDIEANGLLFLCEMGLDPGIDHMSALQLIHRIQANNGHIISFASHCGGLVAPESDDNPWHYKISWNPRNVVMAGKAGAIFRKDGVETTMPYSALFDSDRTVDVPGLGKLAWYPNRDSLHYIPVYGLETATTFVRTTLRYPEFCAGWKWLVRMQFTDEQLQYNTDGLSLKQFFYEHIKKIGYPEDMPAAVLFAKQLNALGSYDDETLINKGTCSAADVLQFALEKKLALKPEDKDMIVMLHEIGYETNGHQKEVKSYLIVKGDDQLHTAMAKTVGLPLGIAAKLILEEKVSLTGLHIPILPVIYEPVLKELQEHGIVFYEQ